MFEQKKNVQLAAIPNEQLHANVYKAVNDRPVSLNSLVAPSRPLTSSSLAELVSHAAAPLRTNLSSPGAWTYFPVTPQWQGNMNSCGTTSLSMVCGALGSNITRQTLDDQIRPANTGVTITQLRDGARQNGFNANIYNNASFEEIAQNIKAQRGVIAYTDVTPDNKKDNKLHYVVVNGTRVDAQGNKYVTITNPAYQTNETSTATYEMRYEDFLKRSSNVSALGISSGINNGILVVSNKSDKLPKERFSGKAQTLDAVSTAGFDFARAYGHLKNKSIGRAGQALAEGVVDSTRAVGFAAVDTAVGASRLPTKMTNKVLGFVSHKIDQAFGEHTAVAKVLSAPFDGAKKAVEVVGKGVDFVVSHAGDLAKSVINKSTEILKDVGSAFSSGVKKAGNFLKKIF